MPEAPQDGGGGGAPQLDSEHIVVVVVIFRASAFAFVVVVTFHLFVKGFFRVNHLPRSSKSGVAARAQLATRACARHMAAASGALTPGALPRSSKSGAATRLSEQDAVLVQNPYQQTWDRYGTGDLSQVRAIGVGGRVSSSSPSSSCLQSQQTRAQHAQSQSNSRPIHAQKLRRYGLYIREAVAVLL